MELPISFSPDWPVNPTLFATPIGAAALGGSFRLFTTPKEN
jgi:hypothetical protein